MLLSLAKTLRSSSARGKHVAGTPMQPKTSFKSRGYRKSAFLKDGSSDEAKKAGSGAGSGNKETFDDFFESLMKGQGQSSRPGGAKGASAGVNLDAILSSLNQPTAGTGAKEEADTRFTEMFQRRAAEEASVKRPSKAEERAARRASANAEVDEFEEGADFQEFLKALKKDYKAGSGGSEEGKTGKSGSTENGPLLDLPSVIQKIDMEMPKEFPDVSNMTREAARQRLIEAIKEANPALAKSDKWRGPMVTRSEAEADMAQTDVRERRMLDEAAKAIYGANEWPPYVTGMRMPNQATGEMMEVDLLQAYANKRLGPDAEAVLRQDEDGGPMDEYAPEEDADSLLDSADEFGPVQETAEDEMSLEHEQAFWSSPETQEMLESLLEGEKSIQEMQYWSLFPKQVKRWVLYTRTPQGYYNDFGEWVVDSVAEEAAPDETKEEDFAAQLTAALDAKDPDAIGEGGLEPTNDWEYWEGVYQNEQQYLPADLRGKYRFHIQPEEIHEMHPRLRRHFSFKFATEGEIIKFRSAEAIRKWGRHAGDSGNSAVQIAVLTLRINHLTKTLRSNPTDSHNGYRLNELVRRRRGLMKHLKRHDLMTYYSLLKDIKLRDQVELWTAARK